MSESRQEFARVKVEDLQFGDTRDVRETVVEELEDRIEATGYSPDKPMRVVRENGHFNVGNGNHRLEALHRQGFEEAIPCVIEPEGTDIDEIALESNRDDTTFAEWDLFDYLDAIERKREDNTQAEIAEFLTDGDEEWSRSDVSNYAVLLDNIATEVLDSARSHQKGRVADDATNVATFDFSEGWFRNSGLYDLEGGEDEADILSPEELSEVLAEVEGTTPEEIERGAEELEIAPLEEAEVEGVSGADIAVEERFNPQQRFIEWFIEEKGCEAGKQNISHKTDELAAVQEQLSLIDSDLNEGVDDETATELREAVKRNEYSTDALEDAIEATNEGAKDRTYFGTGAVEQLAEFEDNEFACVVTDMPYGVEYDAQYDVGRPDFGIDESDALVLLYDVLEECKRVCKANAHLYLFFPMKLYPQVRETVSEFFDVEPVPLIWAKNNIAVSRKAPSVAFKEMYAQQYEAVLHFRGESGDSRELNGDSSANLLEYDIPKGDEVRWHDSQKPIGLWRELIENSTGPGETVLDPFAGSGSSLLAAKQSGRHYVGIEQNDEYESRFKKELRDIESGDGGDQ